MRRNLMRQSARRLRRSAGSRVSDVLSERSAARDARPAHDRRVRCLEESPARIGTLSHEGRFSTRNGPRRGRRGQGRRGHVSGVSGAFYPIKSRRGSSTCDPKSVPMDPSAVPARDRSSRCAGTATAVVHIGPALFSYGERCSCRRARRPCSIDDECGLKLLRGWRLANSGDRGSRSSRAMDAPRSSTYAGGPPPRRYRPAGLLRRCPGTCA
jgi:hypothetical protein